jgi:hypothetical protein
VQPGQVTRCGACGRKFLVPIPPPTPTAFPAAPQQLPPGQPPGYHPPAASYPQPTLPTYQPPAPPTYQPSALPPYQPAYLPPASTALPQRRFDSGGSLWEGLGPTGGILVVMFIFFGVSLLLAVGSWVLFRNVGGDAARRADEERWQLVELAKSLADDSLKRHGIVSMAEDTTAFRPSPGEVVLTGTGSDRGGRMHTVAVEFTVTQSEKEERWRVVKVKIDGQVVFGAGQVAP